MCFLCEIDSQVDRQTGGEKGDTRSGNRRREMEEEKKRREKVHKNINRVTDK